MAMNDAELDRVVESLQRLIGSPFNGAWQPSRDRVIIQVGSTMLLMVPRGPFARIHTTPRRPKNPKRPYSFQGALRARVTGRLVQLEKTDGDRIVELHFDSGRLHLRLTGNRGGLWLLDGEVVRAAYDGPAPDALPLLGLAPARIVHPRFAPEADEDWAQAAARWFGSQERLERERQLRVQLRRRLKRELQRISRLCRNLDVDLERASRAPVMRRQADALAAVLHTLPRGLDVAAVRDLEDPNKTWMIELDPARPPVQGMERLYAQARRMDRAAEQVLERMDHAEARMASIRQALMRVDEAEWGELRSMEAIAPATPRGTHSEVSQPYIRWTGPKAQVVLVGRNATSNRRLTFQTAKGTDWWMHLRGRPGAHIVIKATRGRPPSLDVLLAAAQIALVHGRVPEGTSADVQYTRVKDVRSIPGAPDGRVRLANEKVLHVVRDPGALIGWTRDV